VTVDQLGDGRWLLQQPKVPGWATAARHPGELVAALRAAFTEAQVAAYSDWREHVYDGAVPGYRRHRPASRSRRRCDVYAPDQWKLLDDGRWMSPRGHRYPEDRQVVQRVMRARESLGLAPRPDPVHPQRAEDPQ